MPLYNYWCTFGILVEQVVYQKDNWEFSAILYYANGTYRMTLYVPTICTLYAGDKVYNSWNIPTYQCTEELLSNR